MGRRKLYRLTAADYSTGDYYHYSYDAVGNRLQQVKSIIGLVTTDTYLYDDANRLASVNGVNYTWDNNGNLLSDGTKTYTYDSANRLKTISNQSSVSSFQYNGLGDRLQEIANGQTTSFRMDYNAGLTQVLNDGTNNYIYGNERIAQAAGTGTEYFLDDALGSVRQLTNNSGAVTYASAYDPYGITMQSYGASQSAYGYTGEFTSNEMVYLRARHYAPGMGRFLTRDTWAGDANRPLSFNRWNYVEGNPVNRIDPSGHFGKKAIKEFFGVETWEGVKAFFESGELEGRWGVLELLRRAQPGDKIYTYANEGNTLFETRNQAGFFVNWADSNDDTIVIYDMRNESFYENINEAIRMFLEPMAAGAYGITGQRWNGEMTFATVYFIKGTHFQLKEKPNWFNVTCDAISVGTGIVGLNEIGQIAKTSNGIGRTADMANKLVSTTSLAKSALVDKDPVSTGLSLGGFIPFVGVAFSATSLINDLFEFSP